MQQRLSDLCARYCGTVPMRHSVPHSQFLCFIIMYKRNFNLQTGLSGDRMPISVVERSKARVCGRSLAGVAGLNTAGGMDVCVVCCTVKD